MLIYIPFPAFSTTQSLIPPHTNLSYCLLWYISPQIISHSTLSSLCILTSHTSCYFHIKSNLNKRHLHLMSGEHLHSLFVICLCFSSIIEMYVHICFLFWYLLVSNQIKSNQIWFKVGNVHLKEKKISKKLFTRRYSITVNNKLHISFKYCGTSLWNRTWPQMKIYFSEF